MPNNTRSIRTTPTPILAFATRLIANRRRPALGMYNHERCSIREQMVYNVNTDNTTSNTAQRGYHHGQNYTQQRQAFAALLRGAIAVDDNSTLIGAEVPNVVQNSSRVYDVLTARNLFMCSSCNQMHRDNEMHSTEDDDNNVCQGCVDDNTYMWSDAQDCYINTEEAVDVHSSSRRSRSVSQSYAENNYYYNEYIEQWCTEHYNDEVNADHEEPGYSDDDDDSTNESSNRSSYRGDAFDPSNPLVIASYHANKGYTKFVEPTKFTARTLPLFCGIELEIELKSEASYSMRVEAARGIKELFNVPTGSSWTPYALCEDDGSLHNGFEVVTGWTGLDQHEQRLSALNSEKAQVLIRDYMLRSHDTSTCGLHVTIDRAGMSSLHLSKLVVFVNHPVNLAFITAVCRRAPSENYSRVKSDNYSSVGKVIGNQHGDRYEIINCNNRHTLEFRGARGTLKFETIMATIEFTRMMWLFSKDAAISKLHHANFVDFVWLSANAIDTKYLRPYLIKIGVAPKEQEHAGRLTLTEAWQQAVTMGAISSTVDQ